MPSPRENEESNDVNRGSRLPVPDPTSLTTAQLNSAIHALWELIEAKLNGQANLTEERFRAVNIRFDERDIRFAQSAKDGKDAIDAAFHAASDAVSKSEGAMTKSVDEQSRLISRVDTDLTSKIDDLKERLVLIEGRTSGSASIGYVVATVAALAIAFGAVLVAIIALKK